MNEPATPKKLNLEQALLVKQSISRKSTCEILFKELPKLFNYDTKQVDFYKIIQEALVTKGITKGIVPLEELHKHISADNTQVDEHLLNNITKNFYEDVPGFDEAYLIFRENFIAPLFGSAEYAYQMTPTIRFHFPSAPGINKNGYLFHIDSMIGHPVEETNIWLSLTDSTKHRCFHIADLKNSLNIIERYNNDIEEVQAALIDENLFSEIREFCVPTTCKYGEFVVFDSRCIHGPMPNESDTTRVSIDFRIIPKQTLDSLPLTFRGIGRRQTKFEIGTYYAG